MFLLLLEINAQISPQVPYSIYSYRLIFFFRNGFRPLTEDEAKMVAQASSKYLLTKRIEWDHNIDMYKRRKT